MITIASYSFPYEAHIGRAKLESENIPAFVADDHTINAQWLYSQAMGGVRLQVPNEYAEAARAALAEDRTAELVEEQGHDLVPCPNCKSTDTEQHIQGKRMAFIAFLLLGFPLWRYRYRIRCNACGAESNLES